MSSRASNAFVTTAVLAAVAFVAAVVAWLAWSPVLDLELLGWDSYPLIASGRAHGLSPGAFGDELMGGRYPLGRYWRPLVELTFACDFARSGLDPRGYLADGVAWAIVAALALAWLALELIGGERRVGAFVAAAVAALAFVLQPVLWDVLPAPARRADTMAAAFIALALASARRGGLSRWTAALWVALALASKETGAVALPAVFALAWWTSDVRGWRERLIAVARATWPAFAAFAVALALRTYALGGLGGGRESSAESALSRAPSAVFDGLSIVLAPRDLRLYAPLVLVAALLAFAVVKRVAQHERTAEPPPSVGFARNAGFLATCALLLAAVTALSGVERSWYELPFAALRCVWIALLAGHGAELVRRAPSRTTGIVALALAAWLAVPDALESLRWSRATTLPALQEASRVERSFLDRFQREVERAPDGSRVVVGGFQSEIAIAPRASGKPRTLTLLAPYSVEAYAELALPARRVRLEYPGSRAAPASPGEVVVVLAR